MSASNKLKEQWWFAQCSVGTLPEEQHVYFRIKYSDSINEKFSENVWTPLSKRFGCKVAIASKVRHCAITICAKDDNGGDQIADFMLYTKINVALQLACKIVWNKLNTHFYADGLLAYRDDDAIGIKAVPAIKLLVTVIFVQNGAELQGTDMSVKARVSCFFSSVWMQVLDLSSDYSRPGKSTVCNSLCLLIPLETTLSVTISLVALGDAGPPIQQRQDSVTVLSYTFCPNKNYCN